MEPDGDIRAPGAAITVALCGHWEHDGPCPLAPHHTDAQRCGEEVRLRVLFTAEPGAEAEVRRRIEAGVSGGSVDGVTTRWQFRSAQSGVPRDDETAHAERLVRT